MDDERIEAQYAALQEARRQHGKFGLQGSEMIASEGYEKSSMSSIDPDVYILFPEMEGRRIKYLPMQKSQTLLRRNDGKWFFEIEVSPSAEEEGGVDTRTYTSCSPEEAKDFLIRAIRYRESQKEKYGNWEDEVPDILKGCLRRYFRIVLE